MPDSNVKIRRIIAKPADIRDAIYSNMIEALKNKFPISTEKYTANVSDLHVKFNEITQNQQKEVLMSKGNRNTGIYGDISITDNNTNKVVGVLKEQRIMSIPYYTDRYTMIVDGNEYSVVSQMRTKSGVYTRKRGNDELESSFNLAKGANFKLIMDPDTGVFKIDILGSTFPAIALLKILHAAPSDVSMAIGKELYEKNSAVLSDAQLNRTRNFLYDNVTRYNTVKGTETLSAEEKDSAIRASFAATKLDPETTKITLGVAHTSVSALTIIEAMKKILAVYKGNSDIDERDNLEFQQIHGVEDLLREVIDKNRDIIPKIKKVLSDFDPKNESSVTKFKQVCSSNTFSKPIHNFLVSSTLSRLPAQINPVEFMDSASIITRLGEGAISSERAVPFSTRGVTYSSMGLIDPIAAPESFKVGIDVHATVGAAKGSDREFYKELRDCKTGKVGYHRAIELYDKKVGFPDPLYLKDKKPTDTVYAVQKGKLVKCKRSDLDFQVASPADLCTYTTNTIPLMPANQGNRLLMGDKHVQQSLPLENPDNQLVKPVISNKNYQSVMSQLGDYTVPKSPVDGTVAKVDSDFIYINGTDGQQHRVDYENNLPLASKTFLSNTVTVKPGDKVKQGQALADSNFSKNGEFTTGKNLSVAYMPYKGMNHEDGIVVSEAAAAKMTSVHAEKIFVQLNKNTIIDKKKYTTAFPANFTQEQLSTLDERGIIKKGSRPTQGSPLILVMESSLDNRINQVLGKLSKALMHPYRDLTEIYSEPYEAEVTDTSVTASGVMVILKVHKPLQIGDKLSGSYGNKGVITDIVPTEHMLHDEEGHPLDAVLTSAGVISRINPAQTLETTLGKIALKTGKPYEIENYSKPDYVQFVKDEMKKHSVKDKETLTDPLTGKKIPGVFTGVQHMHKLFKTSDTNFAARGIEGGYDQDETPTGSGDVGPKGEGGMEVNALLASNARSLLREGTMLRSSKNADFWKAFQNGLTPNFPQEKKTFTRFVATLKQAGINVTRKGDELVAAPLTDKDIDTLSSGEVKDALRLNAKTMKPEPGGLYDERLFGGMTGSHWAHVNLAEPVVNPVFSDAARHLLGMNTRQFDDMCINKGGAEIKKTLNAIDVDSELAKTENQLRENLVSKSDIDTTVKKLKCLRALKKEGMKAGDAYVLSKVPVTPPVYRPVTIGITGDAMEADATSLYRDLILQNNSFKSMQEVGFGEKDIQENRKALNQRVRELTGMVAPADIINKNRGVKGAVQFIAGNVPKTGYFYKKLIYGRMNLTGRNTISPDTTLGLNEIGLPIETAWTVYKPFIIRALTKMGYGLMDARDAVEERNETATKILHEEMEKRPVLMNRAPTLWRHGMVAAKPLLREGKNLRINSIWEKGLCADYDGDAVNIHVPVTDEAVADAKKLFASNQIFTDKKQNDLLQAPTREPIIGLYKATANIGKIKPAGAKVFKFANVSEAWKAYYAGTIRLTDYVDIQ